MPQPEPDRTDSPRRAEPSAPGILRALLAFMLLGAGFLCAAASGALMLGLGLEVSVGLTVALCAAAGALWFRRF